MNLQANESTRVTFKGFLMNEVGNLLSVDPDLDPRTLRFDSVCVPLAVLEVLVGLSYGIGSHPSIARFTIDITRLRALGPACLDLDLRPIHPLLGIIVLGLGPNLHPGVQTVMTLDLEGKLKVSIFLVCAEERIGASLCGGSKNGAIRYLVGSCPVALGKPAQVLFVKEILPTGLLVVVRHGRQNQKMGKQ